MRRDRANRHQRRGALDVVARESVRDRRLPRTVILAPVSCAAVERRDHIWLAEVEFAGEQITEEVVVAVPLTVPVERHEQAV